MEPVDNEELYLNIWTSLMHSVKILPNTENGKSSREFNVEQILIQFPFEPAAKFLIVTIPTTIVDPCFWDPGIGFDFTVLTSYKVNNVNELLLLGCTDTLFLIVYSNSMNRVWDPGQQWCVNSYLRIPSTCLSIAYTLALHRYNYDVKHEVLAANFKHTSVLHLHYIIVLATMLLEWKEVVLRSGYKAKFQVEPPFTSDTLDGVLEMIGWAARHRLHHGLDTALGFVILLNKRMAARQVIPELHLIITKSFTVNQRECGCNWLMSVSMPMLWGRLASNTIHRFFKVNISIDRKGIDTKAEWSTEGIAALVSHMCWLLLENMTKVSYVAGSIASISLGQMFRCINLLDIFQIIKHPCHVPKLIKNYATMSRLLQVANQIRIWFLHSFACSNRLYYNPRCRMMYLDSNLEDKVLFGGACIVVNQISSIRAYELEVGNEIGPNKILECFIWDPGPINIWLKGKINWKEEFMHIEENVCLLLFF